LVFEFSDCGPNSLRTMVRDDSIVVPMMDAGFRSMRYKDNAAAVDVTVH